MQVFRLTTRKYAHKLDGVGASFSNNRWNSKGTPMIYTAESRALAMAEVVVHLSAASLPRDFVMLTITIPPEAELLNLDPEQLSPGWNAFPHGLETQKMGDEFIRSGKALAMKVPSAVVQGDFNILINPLHPGINEVRVAEVEDFLMDDRLFP